jgi:trk system potassium uptake protein TrkA
MKHYAIIGAGKFGHYLAVHLYEKGHEVLAIDRETALIQDIKDLVSRAVVADAVDIKALEDMGMKDMDAVVVCIGDSSLSNSILTTLNLKDLGVKRVLAKAVSESHARILKKVGADEVLFPEKDQAVVLSERLHNPNVLDYLPFIEGYSMIQFDPPEEFMGKTLRELNLINQYGIQVLAVKEVFPPRMNMIPTANYLIKAGDTIIALGPNDALEKLRQKG